MILSRRYCHIVENIRHITEKEEYRGFNLVLCSLIRTFAPDLHFQ